jgi:hypothetical protein
VSEVESLLLDLKASIWEMTVRMSNVSRHSDFRYYHSISKHLKNNRQNVESVSTFWLSILLLDHKEIIWKMTIRTSKVFRRSDFRSQKVLLLDLKESIWHWCLTEKNPYSKNHNHLIKMI